MGPSTALMSLQFNPSTSAVMLLALAAACAPGPASSRAREVDPNHGRELAQAAGCGACHIVPGVETPPGGDQIGPPLAGFARRASIAGMLPNTPDELLNWLRAPQSLKPGDAMPDLGLSDADARDIAAYLYLIH
jgi:cytochrome c2